MDRRLPNRLWSALCAANLHGPELPNMRDRARSSVIASTSARLEAFAFEVGRQAVQSFSDNKISHDKFIIGGRFYFGRSMTAAASAPAEVTPELM